MAGYTRCAGGGYTRTAQGAMLDCACLPDPGCIACDTTKIPSSLMLTVPPFNGSSPGCTAPDSCGGADPSPILMTRGTVSISTDLVSPYTCAYDSGDVCFGGSVYRITMTYSASFVCIWVIASYQKSASGGTTISGPGGATGTYNYSDGVGTFDQWVKTGTLDPLGSYTNGGPRCFSGSTASAA